jgi:hypothetical protein
MRFRIHYQRPLDLVRDSDTQFAKGGVLVRVEPPSETDLFDDVEFEIVSQAGSFVLPAQVVQTIPGVGVALCFDPTHDALRSAVDEARDAGETAGDPPAHSIATETTADDTSQPRATQAAGSSTAGKIHMALHGSKEERMRIMRDGDRGLHRYVLRNAGLRLDEVTFIAKMTAVSPDLLKAIAERREWIQRPEIALALVRNPKCPVPLAIQMLNHLSPRDLRQLAKGSGVRMPILQAARKKVIA